jgi:trans-aconitate 2-methyltransferase
MLDWNSKQYLMFENERTQPAIDLVNRICIDNPRKIIDIGCGPGNSTQVLANRFPDAYIIGVDNSPNMIETAQRNCISLDFKVCDVNKDLLKVGKGYDIVFSNACIQWIPNHRELLKNLIGLLKIDGILAIQIPMNYEEPIHKIICEVSSNEKWKSEFNNPRNFYTLSQGEYFDLLSEIASDFSIWETVYYHKIKSHEDIMEWYRGTGLRPYLNALPEAKKKVFEKDVFHRVVKEYPLQINGDIIFRFPRFFLIAKPKGNS